MLYTLQPDDKLHNVSQIFGYTDPKKFFKIMRYEKGSAWIPGNIIEAPSEPHTPRDRPYEGQSHTHTGERGKTMVQGLTMRDIVDCYKRAIGLSASHISPEAYAEAVDGSLNFDLYSLNLSKLDPGAISQNLVCEIERMMGIFPNVPEVIQAEE